ncbi:hypothetical protein ACFX5D_05965 [Flavobacterium sp. LB3P45]|uniref:DUF3078 domain-containing protein n=1 Tax=Flavobacterium fructosi TaxID=3230416 RepID=A0ABW6HKG3_9FLAO
MKKVVIILAFMLTSTVTFAQEIVSDTSKVEKKWDINLDIASRYIWRGQSWGGNYPVAQLYGNYNVNDKFSVGFWTTHNFKKAYYDANGASKGYQELDLILNYAVSDFLTVSVQDYYWPSTDKQEGVSNDFFNFGNDGSQSIDLQFLFDFSEKGVPIWFTLSTLVAGNDFRYKDDNDVKGKQNFTTYVELGYKIEAPLGLSVSPVVGAVLNNKAGYYSYADYDKPSFVNLGCKVSKEIKLNKSITMPIWLNYTYNAASNKANLEPFGKQFLVAGVTFSY